MCVFIWNFERRFSVGAPIFACFIGDCASISGWRASFSDFCASIRISRVYLWAACVNFRLARVNFLLLRVSSDFARLFLGRVRLFPVGVRQLPVIARLPGFRASIFG
ncbi:hypothetical protein RZN25_16375, partial [Bacillaceae bacterium S4-13-56]